MRCSGVIMFGSCALLLCCGARPPGCRALNLCPNGLDAATYGQSLAISWLLPYSILIHFLCLDVFGNEFWISFLLGAVSLVP